MLKYGLLILVWALAIQSCSAKAPASVKSVAAKKDYLPVEITRDTNVTIGGVAIMVRVPDKSVKIKGDLLLLPGWNFSNTKWCDSTPVCDTALKRGFRVIAPQMMQSVYATHYYTETRADLAKYPTLTWLDSAIDILQWKYGLFNNYKLILGLSTGGRGVALICEKKPSFFTAAATLSGDFNPLSQPNDVLTRLVYGPIHMYKQRWKEEDNPTTDIYKLNTPIYIGHAVNDKIVPYTQSRDFYLALKKAHPTLKVKFHEEWKMGHTFAYWRSELTAVWKFFDEEM